MIDTDRSLSVVAILMMMGLAFSALAARRIPGRTMVGMLLGWIAIFGLAFVLFVERDAFRGIGERIQAEIAPDRAVMVGRTMRVTMSPDGHFWVRGRVGDQDARFLIDSGATFTALSAGLVRSAGLVEASGMPVMLQTANGVIVAGRVDVPVMTVGGIELRELRTITSPAFGEINVLGMNFLSGLRRWGVEGRTLILEP